MKTHFKSSSPVRRMLFALTIPSLLSGALLLESHPVQAQQRTTRRAAPKKLTLQQRWTKAVSIYNAAVEVVNSAPVFMVHGKLQSGNAKRIQIYGMSTPENRAAQNGLGTNYDENFLTIHNPNPNEIGSGRYQGLCIGLSQTEFTPVPQGYFTARATMEKYEGIIDSLRQEIAAQKNAQAQVALKRQRAKLAQVNASKKPQRDRVYKARLTIANQEVGTFLSQLDQSLRATAENAKGAAHLQASARATALYNKWGKMGVSIEPLLFRSFEELALAATWQLERGNWKGASSAVEKMLSLELHDLNPKIEDRTGTVRTELAVEDWTERPTKAARLALRRPGSEPAAVSALAKAWMERLPAFVDGYASKADKVRVIEQSQMLDSYIFAPQPGRFETIMSVVSKMLARYGRESLTLLPKYQGASWEAGVGAIPR